MKQFTTCLLCEELITLRHQLTEVIIKIAELDMIFLLGVTLQQKKFKAYLVNQLNPVSNYLIVRCLF